MVCKDLQGWQLDAAASALAHRKPAFAAATVPPARSCWALLLQPQPRPPAMPAALSLAAMKIRLKFGGSNGSMET